MRESIPTRVAWVIRFGAMVVLALGLTAVLASAQEGAPATEGSGTVQNAGTGAAAAGGLGQQVFHDHCVRCHGDDGQAGTRMGQRFNCPPFTTDLLTQLGGVDGIKTSVTEGRENMPPVADLTDEQLQALADYVMTLAH
jgi:mono/diheme cytochrome c family protein